MPTRFNTYFMMLESILLNWDRLYEVLFEKNELDRLENIQKQQVNELCMFLKSFSDISNNIEKSSSIYTFK